MTKQKDFEIPDTMRDLAERSVEQAQDAYNRFADAARSATDAVSQSSNAMAEGAKEVQGKAMKYIEKNIEASFKHAEDIVKAKDLAEALEIQTNFARKQMEAYAEQAQDLSNSLAKAAQKSQPKS